MKNAPKLSDYLNAESRDYFDRVLKALDAAGIPYEVDESIVRGLDYYTHTVFEVISTRPDSGAQSTIFAGGRYDHFVSYYGGPDLSGIGFAIGMERLITLAEDDGYDFGEEENADVYVIGLGDVAAEVLALSRELRRKGLSTEANYIARSLKSQFKSADRSGAKYVVILGENEVQSGTVNIKRTADRTQVSVPLKEAAEIISAWEKE